MPSMTIQSIFARWALLQTSLFPKGAQYGSGEVIGIENKIGNPSVHCTSVE